ncbi:MAG TPA: hypothetical protein ENJ82_15260 [Bacteroidetes bacterium]|nr:hypothetical protein [Bacteroidota bacterium]
MKIDLYSKVVLTVIAGCLMILVLRGADFAPKAYADNLTETPSAQFGLVPMNEDGSINVVVKSFGANDIMDVRIKDIDTYDEMKVSITDISTTDELAVNIDEVGGSSVSSGGPIKVKID